MGNTIILDAISFKSNFPLAVKQTNIAKGTKDFDDLEKLWQEAQCIAGPKALYKLCFIDIAGKDRIFVNGTCLKSRLLRHNLKGTHRIFPFVATCGMELCSWVKSKKDMIASFLADIILQVALTAAIDHIKLHIREKFGTGNVSVMTPGSLKDWPISDQGPLFEILGNIEPAIGVRLTDSLMMTPVQSLSGIIFATGETFESCQLCPRERCSSRRAPFEKGLGERA